MLTLKAIRPSWRGAPKPAAFAALIAIGLVAQACGGLSTSGMGSMGGEMMGGGMMGDGQRFEGATAAPPVLTAPEVRIVAGDLYFDPTDLQISAGQTVNITLDNQGATFHDFTIPALDFVLAADGGAQTSGSLTVPDTGTYEFLCSVPGHAQAGMTGTLTVE